MITKGPMKISELIQILEEHIKEIGDKPVYVLDTENGSYDDIDVDFEGRCVVLRGMLY